jgi:hypothetical protein
MGPVFVKLGRRHLAITQDEKGIYAQAIWPTLGAVIFLAFETWMTLIKNLPK